ncbi:MAG: glutamate-5-semialdehyde dehydrogenase [Gloeomargaritaceae cyanobacterium C42_A2020_066]|nr:glutamate-5-semialdehyde dehydrogenase [Gloeomargaritaceae cyanobacterium C42_A2020_066]
MTPSPVSPELLESAQASRRASVLLGRLSTADKNQALEAVASALKAAAPAILAANETDCRRAQSDQISGPLLQRLKLGADKLAATITGLEDVRHLPDPVGQIQLHRELDKGLVLKRITCPLGVIGVIFEARPEAVIQITALGLKSGNALLLKPGQEALETCQALLTAIHRGLETAGLPPAAVQLLTTRQQILELLHLDEEVDLIIPRGSNAFVRFIQDNTRIPVLGHADGLCHLYVDQAADLEQAVTLTVDSKTQYPAACNAIETLLVHQAIAPHFLPRCWAALKACGVKVLGDPHTQAIIPVEPATETDWATEYLDLILAVRVVADLEEALAHIRTYGSRHTEAIVTDDPATAQQFLTQVDAAGVYHNCSTRFADGFRYGFGAEVGISTAKLPPRGPVGLEGLVTYRYQLVGQGHRVADYSGPAGRPFSHRDL